MYTLQILDAGQTFLHPLDERPATAGSAPDDTIRLGEDGVAPGHVRFEAHADGIRLRATEAVRVNGKAVRAADLQLGDRIEIGRAVLVVGRTVTRPAGPDDVLAPLARASRRRRKRSGSLFAPVLAVVALLAAGTAFAWSGDDRAEVRGLLGYVESLRAKGDLDAASAEVARLRSQWAGSEDDRLERLAAVEAAIRQVGVTRARLEAAVLDPGDERGYAVWSRELQRLEASGAPDEKVAARKVRSRLRALLRRREEAAAAIARPQRGVHAEPPPGVDRGQSLQPVGLPVAADEIEARCREGRYAQALALVQAGFELAREQAAVARLKALEQSVRERARVAMQELLLEARTAAREGRLQHAITLLRTGCHRLPSSAPFHEVGDELARLEAKVVEPAPVVERASPTKVDAADGLATLQSLRSQMDKVRAAEEGEDYVGAARLLRETAEAVRSRDAQFADRLAARADEAERLAGWQQAIVAAVAAGKVLATEADDGRALELVRVDQGRLVARSADGEFPLAWHDLSGQGVRTLMAQLRPEGDAALGAATLLYKLGESAAAEEALASAVGADAGLQPAADRVLMRGRADEHGAAGYVLKGGRFVSRWQLELADLAKQFGPQLDAALRKKSAAARDAFVQSVTQRGETEAAALALAMKARFGALVARVGKSSLRRQVDKLAAERERLDAARRHAKELIFDEVRYFYPYKPPAVSGEEFAEYNRVQAEVALRVAALREVWEGSRTKLRVPKKLANDLDRLDWLAVQAARLGGFAPGESVAAALAPVAWARALEPGATITLQTYCRTPAERTERERWRLIRAYNKAVGPGFSVAVRSLLKITNDYREMFGHRPLAIVESASRGSQGHADEMSQQGYFSHFSPVPERRTPNQRLRLAGYMFGVSENIAKVSGALGAHNAWCRSSGHHRNLLSPSHREIGIGANGRYWVQNFGSGEVHESHPAWAKLVGQ